MRSTDASSSREQLPFSIQTEIPTASDWCQRWQQRTPSWRHVSEGGFDARRYTVEPLPEEEAKAFVLAHHYSASYPSAKERFGLYLVAGGERRLFGVAVFGVPVSEAVLIKPLPELVPYVESLECSRFVLLDECPANSESWFLARTFEALLARGMRGVVSFADPVPRRSDRGALIAVGHVGTIYQASNAAYCGRATARTVKLLPDGTVFNSRAAQKIRRQEQGCEYAAAQLIRLGAPVPRAGVDPALWLRDALVAVGARNVRHAGPHRFCGRLSRVAVWVKTLSGRRSTSPMNAIQDVLPSTT
ncbi:hypothetical protein BN159_0057 [Streptomyces davaonensis JCM 4913]|uniref:Uncharacterized protein n=1 Tax=Streptomyces davaonensis (strain DSM 101723 / JCM 4913 / KCC S-0913 / 768) TaxID=1214101 RepID=K4QSD0_STRDJ|nr:hypothetical protein [Streptomyces davaonensis]CCK24436.1 hypothetical protein BN159_0057 [Streptomyces davaonensis JCM 4913]